MVDDAFVARLRSLGSWRFAKGRVFMWSPELRLISYDPYRISSNQGKLALLHEVGHALLDHGPRYDEAIHAIEEQSAWRLARELARKFGVEVDEKYIQERLDGLRQSPNLEDPPHSPAADTGSS